MSVNNDILLQKLDHLHEKFVKMDSKFETKLYAMEESMKKSVKTSEDNTRAKFEDVKNQIISKMDNILQQQVAETKTFQETSETELQKIVLCEQNKFDGGWTVIQRRFNGSVDFYRDWAEYRNGFGALDGEFWLGLEYVHQITKNQPHELLVEMKDFHGNYGYAKYAEFQVGNESEMYALKKLRKYSGTAKDSMGGNRHEKFSTFDRDNDQSDENCAEQRHGAWWYYKCTYSNLNGRYQNTTDDESAMSWYHFKTNFEGLSYSRMMIRDIIN
ncbi:ficolin-1-like [Anopheles ziemanni]|uniref:ficolin-1-like n=1 Tax=Anopheles coustani TaxID=139045 RepID=UPI002659D63E|nr:ficolin-1-like [Anopheles coustani]XP_058177012.1 ficolin-1-like [Anopheles ziemanni]